MMLTSSKEIIINTTKNKSAYFKLPLIINKSFLINPFIFISFYN